MEVYKKKTRNTKSGYGGPACIAKGCHSKYYKNMKNASFFNLPSDLKRLKKWLINARRPDMLPKFQNANIKTKQFKMCSLHFEPSEFGRKKRPSLQFNAVPTIFPDLKNGEQEFGLKQKLKKKVQQNITDGLEIAVKEDEIENEEDLGEIKKLKIEEITTEIKDTFDLSCVKTENSEDTLELSRVMTENSEDTLDLSRVKTENTTTEVFDGFQNFQEEEKEDNFDVSRVKTEDSFIEVFDGILEEEQSDLTVKKKPYRCPECYKKYSSPNQLTIHFRVHTGERPFACEFCNKRYITKYTLKNHLLISRSCARTKVSLSELNVTKCIV